MNLSKEELQRMKKIDIKDVMPDSLTDISKIEIDRKKPVSSRVEVYVQKVGNPYLVRVGEYVVKIGYSDCEETWDDRMEQYIKKVIQIEELLC